jgi:hypothetical protein
MDLITEPCFMIFFPSHFSEKDIKASFKSSDIKEYEIHWISSSCAILEFMNIQSTCEMFSCTELERKPCTLDDIPPNIEQEEHSGKPVTSALVANRMVANALGLKIKRSEEREKRDLEALEKARGKFVTD